MELVLIQIKSLPINEILFCRKNNNFLFDRDFYAPLSKDGGKHIVLPLTVCPSAQI